MDKSEIDTSNIKVYVDEHKMNQVLRNLLSNAMKFTPKGGVVEIKLQWLHPDARNLRMKPLLHNQYRSFDDENRSSSKKWMESLDGIKSPKSISVTQSSLNSPPSLSTRVTNFFERSTGYNATSTSEPTTKRSFSDIPVPMHEFVGGCSEFGTLLVSVIDSGPGVSKVSIPFFSCSVSLLTIECYRRMIKKSFSMSMCKSILENSKRDKGQDWGCRSRRQ